MRFAAYHSLVRLRGVAERLTPQETDERLPGFDWRGLVHVRNVVIHQYPNLNDDLVWGAVEEVAAYAPNPIAEESHQDTDRDSEASR